MEAVRATLYFDGAARRNPGPGGAGAVLTGRGRTILISVPLEGDVTNNVAEYAGLIAGLRKALALGVTHLEVVGDSELVVFQMTGRYRVTKEHLQLLQEEAAGLVSRFKVVTWRTVPRALNAQADQQANLAADRAEAGRPKRARG